MSTFGHSLSHEQLLAALALYPHPVAVHSGEDGRIEYANDAMISVWGKDKTVIGKTLEEALPELKGQPFIEMFKRVWVDGITLSGTDTPADLLVNGELQTFYFDFEYRAIKDDGGRTCSILHSATNVTARYLSHQREQQLAEELSATNEELLAANEELVATNEELLDSQRHQQQLYDNLEASNSRFKSMVRQAPVGICIINAGDLLVQEVNSAYLSLVGRTRADVENRPIWDAVPEAKAVYAPIMRRVIETGVPFSAKNHAVTLVRNGVPEMIAVDFVYEPIEFDGGQKAIMVLAIDVTDKAVALRQLEEVEERIRLAVESAEIGTFDANVITGELVTSDRLNAIFGFDHAATNPEFVSHIHPDDRIIRERAMDAAMVSGKLHYEARVVHPDQSIHWIRAQGKVFYNDQGLPARILGTVLDITEVKRLSQQKDDFISIASHELKTPVTSLKASLQLLERLKDQPGSQMFPRLLDQSRRSTEKISTLIDDLLNVSRTNESQLKLNKAYFVISKLMENCCNHVRVAGKYTLTIQGDLELQAYADEHAIDQVLVNMVNNAVKYAPESMEIFMIIEKLDGKAKISIRDTGPGIPPEKLPHLFDRYYQAEGSGFQNSGLGLGLYISAEIVKRHQGEIGVESEPGRGSTFWFTLPLGKSE